MRRTKRTSVEQATMAERDSMILALLEERPYSTGELAVLFGMVTGMNAVLGGLARAGRIHRLRDLRWVLPGQSFVERIRPPAPVARSRSVRIPVPVDDLRICETCKRVFAPQISGLALFCSARCEAGAAGKLKSSSSTERTRIIDGVEYEVAWDGVGPLPGSADANGLGSTLSGHNFKAHV